MNEEEEKDCKRMFTRFDSMSSTQKKLNIIFQLVVSNLVAVNPKRMIPHIDGMILEESTR